MGQTDEKFKKEVIQQMANLVKRNMTKTISSINPNADTLQTGHNEKLFKDVEKFVLEHLEDIVYDTADNVLSSFSAQMSYFAELNTDVAKAISDCAGCFNKYNNKFPQEADEFFAQLSQVMLIEVFTRDIKENVGGSNVYEGLTTTVLQAILVD